MPEMAEVEGRRYHGGPVPYAGREWHALQLMGIPDFEEMQIGKITGQEGDYPPPERTLAIERASSCGDARFRRRGSLATC